MFHFFCDKFALKKIRKDPFQLRIGAGCFIPSQKRARKQQESLHFSLILIYELRVIHSSLHGVTTRHYCICVCVCDSFAVFLFVLNCVFIFKIATRFFCSFLSRRLHSYSWYCFFSYVTQFYVYFICRMYMCVLHSISLPIAHSSGVGAAQ